MNRLALVLCVLVATAPPLLSQSRGHGFEFSTGVVRTASALTSRPMTAALLRAGVVQRSARRRVRARLDAEFWISPRRRANGDGPALWGVGVNYGLLMGPRRMGTAPYAVLALGAVAGLSEGNEYGFLGLNGRIGAGVRGRLGGRQVHAEFAVMNSLLPAGRGLLQSLSWPVTVGVTF